jgi:hypothetical protein
MAAAMSFYSIWPHPSIGVSRTTHVLSANGIMMQRSRLAAQGRGSLVLGGENGGLIGPAMLLLANHDLHRMHRERAARNVASRAWGCAQWGVFDMYNAAL